MAEARKAGLLNSSAYRIAFAYAAFFLLLTIILGVAVDHFAHRQMQDELEGQMRDASSALVDEYHHEGWSEFGLAIKEREAGNNPDSLLYAAFTRDGRRVAGSLDASRPPLGWSDLPFRDPLEGPDIARAWAVDLDGNTRLVVAEDLTILTEFDATIARVFAVAFVVIGLLSLIGALILGRYLSARLGHIRHAADEIMASDMQRRIPVGPRGDEFDELAASLNAMLDRISALLQNLRQVSGDLAHDLRTPLARLRNQLETGLAVVQTPEASARHLHDALGQTDHLLRMFQAILRISEIEGGGLRQSFRRFSLSELVAELCDSYRSIVEEGKRSLVDAIEPDLLIEGDRELAAQAVINLLDNAQLHTPEGTRISVKLWSDAGQIQLCVADDGEGIAPADRARAVSRFVRLDPARSGPGHGLGLSLVTAIVEGHGGQLALADAAPGLAVTISLPSR